MPLGPGVFFSFRAWSSRTSSSVLKAPQHPTRCPPHSEHADCRWGEGLPLLLGQAVDLRGMNLSGDPDVCLTECRRLLLVLDDEAASVLHRLFFPVLACPSLIPPSQGFRMRVTLPMLFGRFPGFLVTGLLVYRAHRSLSQIHLFALLDGQLYITD